MIKVRLKKKKDGGKDEVRIVDTSHSSHSSAGPNNASAAPAAPAGGGGGRKKKKEGKKIIVASGTEWLKAATISSAQPSSSSSSSSSLAVTTEKVGNGDKSSAKMKKFKNQKRKERRKKLASEQQQEPLVAAAAASTTASIEVASPEVPASALGAAGAAVDYEEWEVKKTGSIPGWRAAAKAQARAALEASAVAGNANSEDDETSAAAAAAAAPFEGDDADHAETSAQAYEDVIQLLDHVALTLGKTRATLAVYDPYYCDGSVVTKLNKLGFKNVYNRHEDFYVKIAAGCVPDHDVVVTNPPYSADHMEKCFRFCAQDNNDKPWFVLVPNFVYTKNYYEGAVGALTPSYVVPKKRYYYFPPSWAMETAKSRHRHKGLWTSPFPSFWYFHAGTKAKHKQLLAREDQLIPHTAELAANLDTLPLGVRAEVDKKKRKNPKARKRAAKLRLAEAGSADIQRGKGLGAPNLKRRRF